MMEYNLLTKINPSLSKLHFIVVFIAATETSNIPMLWAYHFDGCVALSAHLWMLRPPQVNTGLIYVVRVEP